MGGCATIAGLDEDYSVGSAAPSGVATPTGTATASATGGGTGTGSATTTGSAAGGSAGTSVTGGSGGVGGDPAAGGSGGSGPLTWTVVDTLTVPVNGSSVVSSYSLQSGQWYRLEASGTFFTNPTNDWEADAEYYDFTNVPSSLKDTAGSIDVGIAVDDPVMDGTRTPQWGSYAASHVYTVDWQAAGGPITVDYHDGNHSNNVGSLTLKILALQ